MPSIHRTIVANRLLQVLPKSDLRQLLDRCEKVELAFGEILHAPMERLCHVYFPISSYISLSMRVNASASLEVGLIGSEGMFGIPLALGVDTSPVSAAVMGPGSALRLDGELFCRQLERSRALRSEIDRYVFVHLSQLEQATACTRFHVVEARLARWLLMLQDRACRACRTFTSLAGAPGRDARRPESRRHQGGELAAAAPPHPLQAGQDHRARPERTRGRVVRVLQGGSGILRSGSRRAIPRRRVSSTGFSGQAMASGRATVPCAADRRATLARRPPQDVSIGTLPPAARTAHTRQGSPAAAHLDRRAAGTVAARAPSRGPIL